MLNVLHEKENVCVVVFGLFFGLAWGAVLDTEALDTGGTEHGDRKCKPWFVFLMKRFCSCSGIIIWQWREYGGDFRRKLHLLGYF